MLVKVLMLLWRHNLWWRGHQPRLLDFKRSQTKKVGNHCLIIWTAFSTTTDSNNFTCNICFSIWYTFNELMNVLTGLQNWVLICLYCVRMIIYSVWSLTFLQPGSNIYTSVFLFFHFPACIIELPENSCTCCT